MNELNLPNSTQLSRTQLLYWVNQLLGSNITKIQQLGTGSTYCHLLDVLYNSSKAVQLSKVNFKAKNQYEYVNNFKVLQQSFNKLDIKKYIDVEKLIKCKYQDNLQFLQWFKKLFDSKGNISITGFQTDWNLSSINVVPTEKQLKRPLSTRVMASSAVSHNSIHSIQAKIIEGHEKKNLMSLFDESIKHQKQLSKSIITELKQVKFVQTKQNHPLLQEKDIYYSPSKYLDPIASSYANILIGNPQSQQFQNSRSEWEMQKHFYLRKFKQIQHLFECWNIEKSSNELIQQVRKIVLIPPTVQNWEIDQKTGSVQILNKVTPFNDLTNTHAPQINVQKQPTKQKYIVKAQLQVQVEQVNKNNQSNIFCLKQNDQNGLFIQI